MFTANWSLLIASALNVILSISRGRWEKISPLIYGTILILDTRTTLLLCNGDEFEFFGILFRYYQIVKTGGGQMGVIYRYHFKFPNEHI